MPDPERPTDATPATTETDGVDPRHLEQRLAAVERSLSGTDTPVEALSEAAAVEQRLATAEERLTTVEARLDDLDAAIQAVRGFLGGVRAVNRDVERRADLALARVERLEGGSEAEPRLDPEAEASESRQADDRPLHQAAANRRPPSEERQSERDGEAGNAALAARLRDLW